MNQYVKRTQRDYPLSFKLTVVEKVEKGEMSYRQAQDRYCIQGSHTVLSWLRKYGQPDWLTSPSARKCGARMPETPLTPEQRIKKLEQQHAESEVKASSLSCRKGDEHRVRSHTDKKAVNLLIAQAQTPRLTVTRACLLMGISRQAWYQSLLREAGKEEQARHSVQQVATIRLHPPGRERLFRILRCARLLVMPVRAYHKTTQSHHCFYCHPQSAENRVKSGDSQPS